MENIYNEQDGLGDFIIFEGNRKYITKSEKEAIQFYDAEISNTGDVVITKEIEDKIELSEIEARLRGSKERYTELRELGEMRSNSEETEFQTLETAKNTLLARRKELLDNM